MGMRTGSSREAPTRNFPNAVSYTSGATMAIVV